MGADEGGEDAGEGVGVDAHLAAGFEDVGQRDAPADEFGRGVQQAAADVDELVAVDGEIADVQGRGEVVGGDVLAEVVGEFLGGQADGRLLGPGRDEGVLQAEEFAHVAAGVEGREEFPDAAEGVAALQEGADGAQPGEMVLVVPGDPALAARRRDELALAVEAQRTDRDLGFPGQVGHAEFARRGLCRGFRARVLGFSFAATGPAYAGGTARGPGCDRR